MSAKIGHFKNLLAQDPKTPFAAAKKIELPTHLLAQFAGNELFIKKVFEKIGQGLVNDAQILQICTSLMLSKEEEIERLKLKVSSLEIKIKNLESENQILNAKIQDIYKNPFLAHINADWWNGLDNTWQGIFRKHCTQQEGSRAFFEEIYNLQKLYCEHNQISNLEPLKNLTNLQKLYCEHNQISSLEPLIHLTNLQKLYCEHNQISSLEPLIHLTNLQILYCYNNQISNLEPLKNLVNLQILYCGDNQISSLEPLKNLTNLQNLWCSHNQVSSLEPLKNLAHLKDLNCSYNQISDLEIQAFRAAHPNGKSLFKNIENGDSDWVWVEQGDDYGDEEDWTIFDNEGEREAAEENWEGFLRDQEQSDFDDWYSKDPDNW